MERNAWINGQKTKASQKRVRPPPPRSLVGITFTFDAVEDKASILTAIAPYQAGITFTIPEQTSY